jgi:hypothetical protein
MRRKLESSIGRRANQLCDTVANRVIWWFGLSLNLRQRVTPIFIRRSSTVFLQAGGKLSYDL